MAAWVSDDGSFNVLKTGSCDLTAIPAENGAIEMTIGDEHTCHDISMSPEEARALRDWLIARLGVV